jgi:hypothetical protein
MNLRGKMSAMETFLENLRNVRCCLAVALENVHRDEGAFVTTETRQQITAFEEYAIGISVLAAKLDRELSYLEYLIPRP